MYVVDEVEETYKAVGEEDPDTTLYLDVNIEEGRTARIVVRLGDDATFIANTFAEQHGLTPEMKDTLQSTITEQMHLQFSKK